MEERPRDSVAMSARPDGAVLLERGEVRALLGAEGPRLAVVAAREAARRSFAAPPPAAIARRASEAAARLRHPDADARRAEAAALAELVLAAMRKVQGLAAAWVQHEGATALWGGEVSLALPDAVLRPGAAGGLFRDPASGLLVLAADACAAACAAAVIAAAGDAALAAERLVGRGAILGARLADGALLGLAEVALTKLDAPAPGTT